MHIFKIGEAVQVKAHSHWAALLAGSTGKVVSLVRSGWQTAYAVHFDSTGNIYLSESDIIAAARPCIVAVIEHGKPAPSTRPFVHGSRATATKEAERLAVANPGQEFVTYEAVARSVATRPTVSTTAAV